MRNKGLLLLAAISLCASCFAQRNESTFWKHIVIGGNLGAQFGDITIVQVSPNIGYKITEEWITGIGIRYIYLNHRIYNYDTDIYGGSIFTQYYFLNSFIAHAEVEQLNLEFYNVYTDQLYRTNVISVLTGGGLKLHAGGTTYFTALVLWNLNETPESPYYNPVIRVGIAVGL